MIVHEHNGVVRFVVVPEYALDSSFDSREDKGEGSWHTDISPCESFDSFEEARAEMKEKAEDGADYSYHIIEVWVPKPVLAEHAVSATVN
jgi:hypothetical protein